MTKENRSRPNSKKRGKDGAGAAPGLPPRPYSDYTIFYRMERAFLLQSAGNFDEETIASIVPSHEDTVEYPRPAKYQSLLLPPYWYSSTRKEKVTVKRKHRKREGRMDLATLSRTISTSWKEAGVEIKEYCRKLASEDHKIYKDALTDAAVAAAARRNDSEAAKDAIAVVPSGALCLQDSFVSSPSAPVACSDNGGRKAPPKIPRTQPASSSEYLPFAERRRSSAPPELVGMGSTGTLSSCGPFDGICSVPGHSHPASRGVDCDPEPARQTKRRLTVAATTAAKFEGGGSFTRVPIWKEEVANILLDMLDVPRVDDNPIWVESSTVPWPNGEGVASMSPQHLHPPSFDGVATNVCGLC